MNCEYTLGRIWYFDCFICVRILESGSVNSVETSEVLRCLWNSVSVYELVLGEDWHLHPSRTRCIH